MAKEISLGYSPSANLYAIVKTATGQYANGSTPEAFNAANWGSYAVALAEYATATGQYSANFPALPAGAYRVEVYARAGGSPALGDGPPAFEGSIQWDGAAEVTLASRSTFAGGTVSGVSGPVTVGTNNDKSGYSLNLAQAGLAPRDLGVVADAALTVGDCLVAAVSGAAGKEAVVGTAYTVKTPSTGTTIRAFTLDSATAPTSRS